MWGTDFLPCRVDLLEALVDSGYQEIKGEDSHPEQPTFNSKLYTWRRRMLGARNGGKGPKNGKTPRRAGDR
jgi:hypothetical protein